MNTKVTKRDYFVEILNVMNGAEHTLPTEDVVAFLQKNIDTLDAQAGKAKAKAAEKKLNPATDALTVAILDVLAVANGDAMGMDEILVELPADLEATSGKVSYRLGLLGREGKVVKGTVTVDKKRRTTYAYDAKPDAE